jgi:hypothetical protein
MCSHLKEGLTAAVKTSHKYILYPFVSCIFHWYKYCIQSKSLCLKTLLSSILSWNDKKKYKNIKITYLFHCPFSRKTLITSKQIHFYMFLIGSEHEPVVVRSNWFYLLRVLTPRPGLPQGSRQTGLAVPRGNILMTLNEMETERYIYI